MLNGLDLFSGIGGFALALQDYVRPICHVEIDPYCQHVLFERMLDGHLPISPIWGDVRTFGGLQWRHAVDILTAGFPCQDISVAGRGAGLSGSRSGLIGEVFRLIREVEPTFVFLENVPAIRTRGAKEIISKLARLGYDARWTLVSAAEVGAPHLRERWFCLAAHADRAELRNGRQRGPQRNTASGIEPSDDGGAWNVADPNGTRLPEWCRYEERRTHATAPGKGWWDFKSDVGELADGVPARVDQIRALGNAIVPLQAKTAFERLIGKDLL